MSNITESKASIVSYVMFARIKDIFLFCVQRRNNSFDVNTKLSHIYPMKKILCYFISSLIISR